MHRAIARVKYDMLPFGRTPIMNKMPVWYVEAQIEAFCSFNHDPNKRVVLNSSFGLCAAGIWSVSPVIDSRAILAGGRLPARTEPIRPLGYDKEL